MAKLTTYDSKVDMTTQAATAQKSMEVAAQTGKNIQKLGGAVKEVQEVWQQAKDFSDTLDAKNKYNEKVRDINNRAKADPDPNNRAIYDEELEKAKEESLGSFSSNFARKDWQAQVDNLTQQEKIKLDGEFWGKQIDKTRGDLDFSGEQNKQKYIETGDDHYIIEQKNNIEIARMNGFISEKDYNDRLQSIDKDWMKSRVLKIAEEDWEGALWIIENDNTMTPEEKSAMKNNVETIHKQERIKEEIEYADAEQQMIDDVRNIVKSEEYSYIAKLDAIQRSGLKDTEKNKLKNYLDSADKINATSYDDSYRATIDMIGTLQSGITKKSNNKDMIEYLQRIKDTRSYILDQRTAGRLTQQDEDELMDELNKVIKPEESYAKDKLTSKLSPVSYGYNNASKDFDRLFDNDIAKSDAAMRKYFQRVAGKKISSGEKRVIMTEVWEEEEARYRKAIVGELEKGSPESKAYTRTFTDGDVLDYFDYSEVDVTFNMKKYGKTREEVIAQLRASLP